MAIAVVYLAAAECNNPILPVNPRFSGWMKGQVFWEMVMPDALRLDLEKGVLEIHCTLTGNLEQSEEIEG